MYEWHKEVETPSDDEVIWRYLSIEKYIDLLYKKQLYLCRLDKFEDSWEGKWTDAYIKRNPYSRDCLEGDDGLINEIHRWYFICCWHLAKYESVAMWKIYSSEHAGIAIKTSIKKLKDSLLNEEQQIHIGKVNYIEDHATHEEKESDISHLHWGGLSQTCIKRQCFEYEKEVRLIECNQNNIEFSYIDINLKFIDEVRLSPLINNAFIDSIRDVSSKFGINPDVIKKSRLYTLEQ